MKKSIATLLMVALMLIIISVMGIHAVVEVEVLTYSYDDDTMTAVVSSANKYITPVVIPETVVWQGKTYTVTGISAYAFADCTALKEITIPSSISHILNGAFHNCNGLTDVYIEDINAWLEIDFWSSLSNPLCSADNLWLNGELVEQITFPDGITEINDYVFCGYKKLTQVTIPDSVTTIGYSAFSGCSGLTKVTIPDSVTTIEYRAFSDCGLTEITIPNSVRTIGEYAFDKCDNFTDVYIEDINAWLEIDFESTYSNPLYYAGNLWLNGELVEEFTFPDGITEINNYAFCGYKKLTQVTIPNSVRTIGGYAFYHCIGLTGITIPNSVKTIEEYAFCGCSGLTEIAIPDSVTYIGKCAFSRCEKLTQVTIPNSVTYIASNAFSSCYGLTEIIIPDGVTTINTGAFYGCSGLTKVTIPDSVRTIGEYAFYGCTGLTEIIIPSGVTTIESSAFEGCKGLKKITIPSNVTTIGGYAFADCTGLTELTIEEGVTGIGNFAFQNCIRLEEVVIPNSAIKGEDFADTVFANCDSINIKLTCIITYDANGGAGAPEPTHKLYGDSVLISWIIPQRDHYPFLGWSSEADGKIIVSADTRYSAKYIDKYFDSYYRFTLYAVWGYDHTVSYDANGGVGAPDPQIKNHGTVLHLSMVAPQREGYVFKGWSTSQNGSVEYASGGEYTLESDAVLYAVWLPTYTVSYDANGGVGAPDSQTKNYGTVLHLSTAAPQREGYVFKGWSTVKDGVAEYESGDVYATDCNTTLYAVWCKVYTVTYVIQDKTETAQKLHDEELELEKCWVASYKFMGWALEKGGEPKYYYDFYSDNADITLYAVLVEKCHSCTNGSVSTSTKCTNNECNNGKVKIVCPDCKGNGYVYNEVVCSICDGDGRYEYATDKVCDVCLREGYDPNCALCRGTGSYKGVASMPCTDCSETGKIEKRVACSKTIERNCSTCGGDGWTSGSKICTVCGGTDIASNCYVINYNANGGTGAPASQKKSYLENMTLSSEAPQREGYTFLGWSTSKNGEVEYLPGEEFDKNDNFTLYAVWEEGESIEEPLPDNPDMPDNPDNPDMPDNPDNPTAEYQLGDVNADGKIDQYDYILVKRHYFETRALTDNEMARADVNKDGTVDQFDYILIARHYFGTFTIKP